MILFKDIPIQKKLVRLFYLISAVILLVTCVTFFTYEYFTFRIKIVEKVSVIGKIMSANSTAALAFDDSDAAKEILTALKNEPHIVAACLYNKDGKLFCQYTAGKIKNELPVTPGPEGYHFTYSSVEGFQPVLQDTRQLGTLYIRSDLGAMYERFRLYGIMMALVVALSFFLAFLFSKILQRSISRPILALAKTAEAISDRGDYSVRADKHGNDEVGMLTDAFNHMLIQIEQQNQNQHLSNEELQLSREQLRHLASHLQDIREEERRNISREIHDELGQQLTAIKMDLGWLNKKDQQSDPVVKEKISDMIKMADEAIKTLRKIASQLRPVILDDMGLIAALEWQSDEFEKRTSIECSFSSSLEKIVTENTLGITLFRIYQEALTNITRHSGATKISSSLNYDNDTITLVVSDNGKGFDINLARSKGTLGMLGMKERALAVNGELIIDSKPGKGTTITVKIPVPNPSNISVLYK